MSDTEKPKQENSEPESTGPSLILLYSLIALALVIAVGFAVMIVLPFYQRSAH